MVGAKCWESMFKGLDPKHGKGKMQKFRGTRNREQVIGAKA
jgi:hypothetical protein